ncbi:MAG TPA: hypothetical protein GX715_00695 [Armatimonadetes bacterium]|nr:hypothetical protein [Armatimonadota bacterium]
MIRRSVVAAAVVLLLLALASLAWVEGRRAPMRAEALLRWIDARRGRVPHTAVVVTTTFAGGRAITTTARLLCTGDRRSRIEYLTPPLKGVVAIQHGGRIHREGGPTPGLLMASATPCEETPSLHQRRFELLLRNYEARDLGGARAAGRPARRLLLIHRHTHHVARRWWVDPDTGLILRTDDFRADGTVGVRTVYREVKLLPPHRAERVQASIPYAPEVPPPLAEAELLRYLGLPGIRPRYVPVGYEYEAFSHTRCGCPCGEPVAHIQYSDGLRALSVFASRHLSAEAEPVAVMLPVGDMLRLRHRGVAFAFLGEVGLPELHRMARSLP